MENRIKQFKSNSIKHAVVVLHITFYAYLMLFVVFVNQGKKPSILLDINESVLESAVHPKIMFLASRHTQLYQHSLVNKHLYPEDSAFSGRSFSQKQTKNQDNDLTEVQCLALNIYFEARGESEVGQHAVGHVVLNRVASGKFPKSICDVVRQGGEQKRYRCQFSWWCDGRSDKPRNKSSWRNAMKIATEIANGDSSDPTGGALWYHADYVSPYWRTAFLQGPTIGQHIFYFAQTRQS